MKPRTFKNWNNKGYRIKKGSKAVGFNNKGKALFNENQVYKPDFTYHNYEGDGYFFGGDNPDEMDYDLGLCGQI